MGTLERRGRRLRGAADARRGRGPGRPGPRHDRHLHPREEVPVRRHRGRGGGGLSFIGLIHAPEVEWAANNEVALGYLMFAAVCVAWSFLPGADDARRGGRVGRGGGPLSAGSTSRWRAHTWKGLPLHHELVERGARLRLRTTTAPGVPAVRPRRRPARPGRAGAGRRRRAGDRGRGLPPAPGARSGDLLVAVPPPLAIGTRPAGVRGARVRLRVRGDRDRGRRRHQPSAAAGGPTWSSTS